MITAADTRVRLCLSCMRVHEVKTVSVPRRVEYRGRQIAYSMLGEYCELTGELLQTPEQADSNDISLKDGFRKQSGLLTSREITDILGRYDLNSRELEEFLGWDKGELGKYMSHSIQDRAHDTVLRIFENFPGVVDEVTSGYAQHALQ